MAFVKVESTAVATAEMRHVAVCEAGPAFVVPNSWECMYVVPAAVGATVDCSQLRSDPGDTCFLGSEGFLSPPSAFANPAESPSGSASGVTVQPFEYSSAQQVEVYTALAVVFGVFLAAMALVWGYKQILKVLSVGAPGGD